MPFHTIAFSVSHDPAGAFTPLTPVPDQSIRANGNGYIVPPNYTTLIGAAAFLGALGGQARIEAPSLREIANEYITPVEGAISPAGEHFHTISPNRTFKLTPEEQLEVHENSNPAAAELHTVVLWLSDQDPTPLKGPIRTISGTIGQATTAGAWVNGGITLTDVLPPGTYTIVGMRVEGANIIAARLVIPGQTNRPGVLAAPSNILTGQSKFRYGDMGELGTFNHNQLFSIDLLSSTTAAAATRNIFFDIIAK